MNAMNCRKFKEVVFLYTDNEMEGDLLVSFRAHRQRCPGCAEEVEFARRFVLLIRRRCRRSEASEALRRKILRSFPHRSGRIEGQIEGESS